MRLQQARCTRLAAFPPKDLTQPTLLHAAYGIKLKSKHHFKQQVG